MSFWSTAFKLPRFIFNRKAAIASLRVKLQQAADEAGETFIKTFVSMVPSYTGASRAQLLPLGDLTHNTVPITVVGRESRVSEGRAAGGASIDISNDAILNLEVTTNWPWFQVNETNDARKWGIHLTNPGPYNVLPAAEAAADAVLEQTAAELQSEIAAAIMTGWRMK
jgi:hypothetical protein